MTAQVQNSPFTAGRSEPLRNSLYSPLRFCGRQWSKIEKEHRPLVLKVFVACAAFFAAIPALIGALILPPKPFPSETEMKPNGSLSMLYKHKSNELVAQEIAETLQHQGCTAQVEVTSSIRVERNNYYPDNVSRSVTLRQTSTLWERIQAILKYHFHNEEIDTLKGLYPCIWGGSSSVADARLKSVLALYPGVSFYIAFDLAYVRTELIQ